MTKLTTLVASLSLFAACTSGSSTPTGDDTMTGDDGIGSDPLPDPQPTAGTLDKSFGTNGILELPLAGAVANDIITQGDKLVVCATMPVAGKKVAAFMRFDDKGVVDPSFGTNGLLTLGAGAGDASCKDLEPAIGEIYALMHFETVNLDYYVRISANGDTQELTSVGSTKHLTAAADGAVVYSLDAQNFAYAVTVTSNLQLSPSPGSATAVSDTTRAIQLSSLQRVVVANNDGLSPFTTVMIETPTSLYDLPTGHVNAGDSTPDIVMDAVLLPDGSVFAVGGADFSTQTMALRWNLDGQITGTAEAHAVGTNSYSRSVALDAAGRPVVVGTATVAGMQQFMWARYDAASVTLDADFQGGAFAAPSGDGELVGVTGLNGAMYALGTYDVETASPKIALLKIVE